MGLYHCYLRILRFFLARVPHLDGWEHVRNMCGTGTYKKIENKINLPKRMTRKIVEPLLAVTDYNCVDHRFADFVNLFLYDSCPVEYFGNIVFYRRRLSRVQPFAEIIPPCFTFLTE